MIDGSTDPENYRMIQHHLAMYNTGSLATVLQEKLVLFLQILCNFMWSCFWGNRVCISGSCWHCCLFSRHDT